MARKFGVHDGPAAFVKYHLATINNVLFALPIAVWAVPFVVFFVLYALSGTPASWLMAKPLQEVVAPVVIGMTAAAALATHHWVRHFFTLLVAIFCCSLFLRELHFGFTQWAIYFALIGLCYWGSERRDEVMSFGITRPMMVFFTATVLTYIMADLVDRHALRPLEFILGSERVWQNAVEETSETMAHLFNFGFVLTTLWRGAQLKFAPK